VENSLWTRLWTGKLDDVMHAYILKMGPRHACRSKAGCWLAITVLVNHRLASKTQINDDVCDLTSVSISNILIALVIDE
jgi:hypothetical protein